ncbi:MAG: hypothetical protein FH749_13030 [Firmicutes bacterium]|nr:hypothetical protein [Bacillota bacterium]
MELKIVKGNRKLTQKALYHQGEVYLPVQTIETWTGLWNDVIFYDSPLHNKRICLTIISPDLYNERLPAGVEKFAELCSAAGAIMIYHNGGPFPPCDLAVVIELGGRYVNVNYLGFRFRSMPLARRIGNNLKQGLKLAYLPDPLAFRKPQYNLKFGLFASLKTPGIVVQWPTAFDQLATWLFASIMEHFGDGESLDGEILDSQAESETSEPAPAPQPVTPEPSPKIEAAPAPELTPAPAEKPETQDKPLVETNYRRGQITRKPPAPGGNRQPASMSQSQYPEFFKKIEEQHRQRPKREPFG